jgi:CRP-like cAMP-binding protein
MLESAPPRGLGERLLALRSCPPLAALPPMELAWLARGARERDFPAGETLAVQGHPPDVVLLVLSGQLQLTHAGRPLREAEAFEALGLLPLAARVPHPFGATALSAIHALEIDADAVGEVLEDDAAFFGRLLQLAATQAQAARNRSPVIDGPGRARSDLMEDRGGDAAAGALGTARTLLALRDTALFRRAPLDGLAAFAKKVRDVQLPAGQRRPMAPGELAIIAAGQADVGGASAGPGAVVGAFEALTRTGPPGDLHARTDVHLLCAPISELYDVLEDHHGMGSRLLGELLGELTLTIG